MECTTRRSEFSRAGFLIAALQAMRPAQWLKNGFVLVPLFFSGQLAPPTVLACAAGAMAFVLLSSAVYVFNDVCDRDEDRRHAKKRLRPVASGRLSVRAALILAACCLLAALVLAWAAALPGSVLVIAGIYLAVNLGYSLGLKTVPVMELFLVSSGYVLRLLAGGAIDGEPLSAWIIVCTGLVSLMLAAGKRRADLAQALDAPEARASLRHYTVFYLDQMTGILAAATFVTYLLFCMSDYGMARFGAFVPLTSIFVLFGIFRFLQIVWVENGGDAPTDMVLHDIPLRTAILMWIATYAALIYAVPYAS